MTRLINAIRVLMGKNTLQEVTLSIILEAKTALLAYEEMHTTKLMALINKHEEAAALRREARKNQALQSGKIIEELQGQLVDSRAKVKDLKRIIGTMKNEKENEQ